LIALIAQRIGRFDATTHRTLVSPSHTKVSTDTIVPSRRGRAGQTCGPSIWPPPMEITMRNTILVTPILVLLASGAAFAQSGQGGYLGKNPTTVETTSQAVKPPAVAGSGQGGYLGEKAGENQLTASQDPVKPPPATGSGRGGYLGQR
jgi:hypothetical protein